MIRTPKPATAMAQMATLLSLADVGDAVAVEVGWASATVAEAASVCEVSVGAQRVHAP